MRLFGGICCLKWAKLRAADIARSADVRALMASIHAPIVANQVLASASAIFTWAIKEELAEIKTNPCHGVERNPTQSRDRVLSDNEVPRFWTAFEALGLPGQGAANALIDRAKARGNLAYESRTHRARLVDDARCGRR